MLLRKNNNYTIEKNDLLERLRAAKEKCILLEKKFSKKNNTEAGESLQELAVACRESAVILEKCAEYISRMLLPRDRRKASEFQTQCKKLLDSIDDSLRYVGNGFNSLISQEVVPAVNELQSLILKFIQT